MKPPTIRKINNTTIFYITGRNYDRYVRFDGSVRFYYRKDNKKVHGYLISSLDRGLIFLSKFGYTHTHKDTK